MELTVNQALALVQAEIAKTTASTPIKNTAVRQAGQLTINVGRLGIGGAVILTVKDPPKPRSGRSSKRRNEPKAAKRSANSTTGRRG